MHNEDIQCLVNRFFHATQNPKNRQRQGSQTRGTQEGPMKLRLKEPFSHFAYYFYLFNVTQETFLQFILGHPFPSQF